MIGFSNLVQRTISGIVYLIIMIGSLFLGKYTYGAVFLIAGLLALVEYYNLSGLSGFWAMLPGLLAASIIYTGSFLILSGILSMDYIAVMALIPVLLFINALYSRKSDYLKVLSVIFLGILYIIIPLAVMHYLAFPQESAYTHRIILGILTLVWINDTGAYVIGSVLGKHKLFPRISPKKSWEGLVGGTLFTLMAALLMNRLMGNLTVSHWVFLAVIVSVFGVYGDLVESYIKRNAGIKDSGILIPGHGGILDRIDSILFVMPVSAVYLVLST